MKNNFNQNFGFGGFGGVPQGNAEQKLSDAIKRSDKILSKSDLDNYNINWLIDNFIARNQLIQFYAKAGSGKSLSVTYLAMELLKNNKIDKVFYFDGDNGYLTLKNRHMDYFIDKYSGKLFYYMYHKKSQFDYLDIKKLIFDIALRIEFDPNFSNSIIIFDSITNFINSNMSFDNEVKPYLEAMQKIRQYSAGVWFLNHQSKQVVGENNKAYKGSTVFEDGADESFFVKKYSRIDNELIVTLEAMKQRDDAQSQALIINTDKKSLEFAEFNFYNLDEKQSKALEFAIEIINENDDGINLKNLVFAVSQRAKEEFEEICGVNAMKKLFKKFNSKFYLISQDKNNHNMLIFKPVKGEN